MKCATAFSPCYYAIIVMVLTLISLTRGETMVSVAITSDGEDGLDLVKGGDSITFLCNIIGYEDGSIISILRTSNGSSDTLYSSIGQPDDIPNVEFRGFTDSGSGSRIYMVMINNVTKLDIGRYSCVVLDGVTFALVDAKLDLNIRYLPNAMYPICDIVNGDNSLIRYEDERVTMRCGTEVGNPEVDLDWMMSGRRIRGSDDIIQNGIKYIEIVIDLQLSHDGQTFDCVMRAGLDHNYEPTCSVGPFNIQRRLTTTKSVTKSPTNSASTHQVTTASHLVNLSPETSKQPVSLGRTMNPDHVTTIPVTMVSNPNRSETTVHRIDTTSRLSRVNIALICIFIILILWVAIVFAIIYVRRSKSTVWAPPDIKVHAVDTTDSNANLTNYHISTISGRESIEQPFINADCINVNEETEDTLL